jgi:alpha,alpha-trehalose phosphorylase
VIPQLSFALEPWRVHEESLDLNVLAQTESVFALANGHLGLRGNLEEGEPSGMPGTYLNGVYESRPLLSAEAVYGDPESSESLINVTDGKVIRLQVDDEPFDVRYGDLRSHHRILDLRAGTLSREAVWVSPAGLEVTVRSTRLVSFTQRAVAAIQYEVEACCDHARIVVQSELIANEPLPRLEKDPRVAAALEEPLEGQDHAARGTAVVLGHRTKASQLNLAAAMDHEVAEGPKDTEIDTITNPDTGLATFSTVLSRGQRFRIVKYLGYGWSSTRSRRALRDQVAAALTAARHTGWDGLVKEQRDYLDNFWDRCDVEVDGDAEIQQSVRFALFHVLQAGARAERRPIAAKGLTGTGYDGHVFWDTETYVLPLFVYAMPQVAADVLRWRQSILPAARERARQLRLQGAAFPWRTISGPECSGYWPAGTAAFHINADIAAAVLHYVEATEDEDFLVSVGLELLIETARLWRSLGHHDRAGQFRIDGVTGPDEYSAIADNNVYTNLLAEQNLRAAAEAVERYPDEAAALGVRDEEVGEWRAAAAAIFIPFDQHLGVHPQADGFTNHQVWNFAGTKADQYPLLLFFPYFDLYRKQVVKQADLVLAMLLRSDFFDEDQKARNFAYYERLTVRDSSLSASAQAVIAAEVGHLDLAYDYLAEGALIDLEDLEHNTRDGLHMAALAGSWTALVAGFGGLRAGDGKLTFAPRLPEGLTRLAFNLCWHDCHLWVSATPNEATYQLKRGDLIEISHHGQPITVKPGEPVTRAIPPAPQRPRPRQPATRAPEPRFRKR